MSATMLEPSSSARNGRRLSSGRVKPSGRRRLPRRPGQHHVVPRPPLLDALVGQIGRIAEHGLEDRREVDRHRVAVLEVVLLLVEEPQELEGLVRVLGLAEDGPVLSVERGDADLARRAARPQHRHEVLGVPHALGRVLLDVADGPRAREIAHGDLAGGQRGLRVEVLLSRPALRLELVQLLQVVERLQHRLAVELRPPRLGVHPGAAVRRHPLRRVHEAHVELLARHLKRVAAVLGEGRGEHEHVVHRSRAA